MPRWGPRTEPDWQEVDDFVRQYPEGADRQTIADRFGMNREYVRSTEIKALKKLQRLVQTMDIRLEDCSVDGLAGTSPAALMEEVGGPLRDV